MNKFKIEIPSKIELITPVTEALNSICDELPLDNDKKWALEISLREALANAIVHGNKKDPTKQIFIDFLWDEKSFIITIEDEGKGFVPSKEEIKPSLDTCGRGMTIIKSKMDSVEYKKGKRGFKLILEKIIK